MNKDIVEKALKLLPIEFKVEMLRDACAEFIKNPTDKNMKVIHTMTSVVLEATLNIEDIKNQRTEFEEFRKSKEQHTVNTAAVESVIDKS
jgi:hypothetical protein